MRTTHRKEKVASLLKEEISKILLLEMRDPNLGFVTVTGVNMSSDLKTAIIYVSILGNSKQREKALNALNKGKGYLRKAIASKINLKYNPKLIFELDDSIAEQAKIERILSKIRDEQGDNKRNSREDKRK